MNREEAVKTIENTELIMQGLDICKKFYETIKNTHEAKLLDMTIKLIQAYEFLYNTPPEFYPTPPSPEYFEYVMNKAGEGFHKYYTNKRIDDLYKKFSDIEKRLEELSVAK